MSFFTSSNLAQLFPNFPLIIPPRVPPFAPGRAPPPHLPSPALLSLTLCLCDVFTIRLAPQSCRAGLSSAKQHLLTLSACSTGSLMEEIKELKCD